MTGVSRFGQRKTGVSYSKQVTLSARTAVRGSFFLWLSPLSERTSGSDTKSRVCVCVFSVFFRVVLRGRWSPVLCPSVSMPFVLRGFLTWFSRQALRGACCLARKLLETLPGFFRLRACQIRSVRLSLSYPCPSFLLLCPPA